MAHYIAELIHDAENASAEERPAKMQACSEAILNLWRHRQGLPNGKRPFEEVEPILRSLKSLDPDDDTPRYFRSVRNAVDDKTETDEAKSWLKLVDNLDYTARILIRYCLTQAAQSALNKSAKWVALAEAAVADDGIESPIVRLIAGETELLDESDPDEIQKKQLQDRIARLEGFIEMANAVVAKLREHLQQSPSSESNS
jgi:hypothetical protein